jgi:hypothetical protein
VEPVLGLRDHTREAAKIVSTEADDLREDGQKLPADARKEPTASQTRRVIRQIIVVTMRRR